MRQFTAPAESDARPELIAEMTQVLRGMNPREKLLLDDSASGFDIVEAVRQKKIWAQEMAFSFPDPAEEAALVTLQRAYSRHVHQHERLRCLFRKCFQRRIDIRRFIMGETISSSGVDKPQILRDHTLT